MTIQCFKPEPIKMDLREKYYFASRYNQKLAEEISSQVIKRFEFMAGHDGSEYYESKHMLDRVQILWDAWMDGQFQLDFNKSDYEDAMRLIGNIAALFNTLETGGIVDEPVNSAEQVSNEIDDAFAQSDLIFDSSSLNSRRNANLQTGKKKLTGSTSRIDLTRYNIGPNKGRDVKFRRNAGQLILIYRSFNFGELVNVKKLRSIGIARNRAYEILSSPVFSESFEKRLGKYIQARVPSAKHFALYLGMSTERFIDHSIGIWSEVKDRETLESAELHATIEAKNKRGIAKMSMQSLATRIGRSIPTARKRLKKIRGLIISPNWIERLVESVEDIVGMIVPSWAFLELTKENCGSTRRNIKNAIKSGELARLLSQGWICHAKWRTVNSYAI